MLTLSSYEESITRKWQQSNIFSNHIKLMLLRNRSSTKRPSRYVKFFDAHFRECEKLVKSLISNCLINFAAQKMRFSIKDFFSKCEQIRRKPRIWSLLLKKSLMENFIFCAVFVKYFFRFCLDLIFLKNM